VIYLILFAIALMAGVAIGMVIEWSMMANEQDRAALEERFKWLFK
jgi:hypothetical protein